MYFYVFLSDNKRLIICLFIFKLIIINQQHLRYSNEKRKSESNRLMDLNLGKEILKKYQIMEKIGTGAFGQIYRVCNKQNKTEQFAVKF